jgi:hypothetical protein
MNTVRKCIRHQRDEMILTFFVNEMHRLAEKNPNMTPALNKQFGSDTWRLALEETTEATRKEAFGAIFESSLKQQDDKLGTGRFGIRVQNQTSRYELVFATHSESGLECWSNMIWRVDKIAGRGASAHLAEEPDLFGEPITTPLRDALLTLGGSEVSWDKLVSLTLHMNFKETHLRKVLYALNEAGLAFRIEPLESKSDWPTGCRVRIYDESEVSNT